MATELAKAYVQIIPSAQGMEGALTSLMNGEAQSAGNASGQTLASSLAGKLKGALVGLGIGKAVADAISSTGEFETAMAKVSTLFTGTGDEFSALSQKILEVSSATGMSATSLAEAAYSAESASVPMEQLGAMIESSAKLAVAGFTDVDTALSATAKTMNAYGDRLTDVNGNIMDMAAVQKVLIQAQNKGITTVGELGASLANVTPTAAAMGVSFDQVGAALAQMTAQGVPTAQATTQLRSAMAELGKAGTKADKAFREAAKGTKYAGKSFQEAISSGATLGDVFGMMQNYADASGLSMIDLWSSVEAGNAAMMIASDLETFNEDLAAMTDTANVVEESYQKMASSFGQSMNSLKESAKNLAISIFSGADLGPAVDQLVSSLGDVGQKVLDWLVTGLKNVANNLPALASGLIDLGGILLSSLAEVDWIQLGTDIINGIISGLGTLGSKLIELVGNGINAITSGQVDFGQIGTALLNGVKSIIDNAGNWLKTLFSHGAGAVATLNLSGLGQSILNGVHAFIDATGGWLSALFGTGESAAENNVSYTGLGTKIKDGVTNAIDESGKFLSDLFQTGKDESINLGWDTVGQVIRTGVKIALAGGEFLASAFRAGKTLIEKIDWATVGQNVNNLLNTGLQGAADVLETAFEGAKTFIAGIGWDRLAKGATKLMDTAFAGAADVLEAAFTGAKTFISNIGWDTLAKGATKLMDTAFTGAADVLKSAFQGASDFISGIQWEQLGADASGLLSTGLQGAADILETQFTAARDFISGIQWQELGKGASKLLSTGLKGAADTLEAAFSAAHTFITQGIDWAKAGQDIQSGLGDVWSGLTSLLGGLGRGAGAAAEGIGQGIGDAAGAAGGWLAQLLSGEGSLSEQIEQLKTNMSELENAVKNGKETAEAAAKEVSKAIKDGLATDLGAEALQKLGTDAMSGLAGGIVFEGPVQNAASAVTTGIDLEFTNYDWNGVGRGAVTDVGTGIGEKEQAMLKIARKVAKSTADEIKGADWAGVGHHIMDTVGTAISTNSHLVLTEIDTVWENGVNSMGSGWDGVGEDMIAGMIAGINANANLLYNRLKDVAKNALNAAKKALGIASPSTVMRDEVGKWIPAGIAAGITRNSGMVTDAMAELSAGTAEGLSGALERQESRIRTAVQTGNARETDGTNLARRIERAIENAAERINIYLGADKVGNMTTERVNYNIKAGDTAVLRGMGG